MAEFAFIDQIQRCTHASFRIRFVGSTPNGVGTTQRHKLAPFACVEQSNPASQLPPPGLPASLGAMQKQPRQEEKQCPRPHKLWRLLSLRDLVRAADVLQS